MKVKTKIVIEIEDADDLSDHQMNIMEAAIRDLKYLGTSSDIYNSSSKKRPKKPKDEEKK